MRIGALQAVVIDGVTFFIKPTYGARNRAQDAALRAGYADGLAPQEQADAMARFREMADGMVRETVKRVDGIEDDDGKPLTWDAITLDDLPPDMVEQLTDEVRKAHGLQTVPQDAGTITCPECGHEFPRPPEPTPEQVVAIEAAQAEAVAEGNAEGG